MIKNSLVVRWSTLEFDPSLLEFLILTEKVQNDVVHSIEKLVLPQNGHTASVDNF